jgi:Flp pilus assembly pilin Flp
MDQVIGVGSWVIGFGLNQRNWRNQINALNAINDLNEMNDPNILNALRPAPCPMPLANERGQAMVEYLLATVLAALVIGAAFAIFFAALRGYYGLLTFLVGLPVP